MALGGLGSRGSWSSRVSRVPPQFLACMPTKGRPGTPGDPMEVSFGSALASKCFSSWSLRVWKILQLAGASEWVAAAGLASVTASVPAGSEGIGIGRRSAVLGWGSGHTPTGGPLWWRSRPCHPRGRPWAAAAQRGPSPGRPHGGSPPAAAPAAPPARPAVPGAPGPRRAPPPAAPSASAPGRARPAPRPPRAAPAPAPAGCRARPARPSVPAGAPSRPRGPQRDRAAAGRARQVGSSGRRCSPAPAGARSSGASTTPRSPRGSPGRGPPAPRTDGRWPSGPTDARGAPAPGGSSPRPRSMAPPGGREASASAPAPVPDTDRPAPPRRPARGPGPWCRPARYSSFCGARTLGSRGRIIMSVRITHTAPRLQLA